MPSRKSRVAILRALISVIQKRASYFRHKQYLTPSPFTFPIFQPTEK